MRQAAVGSTQMVPAVISPLKRTALVSLPNLSILWLQNTDLQIVMNKIDIFTGSIKYSGVPQFNPFQVDSYCWVHSLKRGRLVIGTVKSIQIHPLQMGYYLLELVEIGMLYRVFNLFGRVVKDSSVTLGQAVLLVDKTSWLSRKWQISVHTQQQKHLTVLISSPKQSERRGKEVLLVMQQD